MTFSNIAKVTLAHFELPVCREDMEELRRTLRQLETTIATVDVLPGDNFKKVRLPIELLVSCRKPAIPVETPEIPR